MLGNSATLTGGGVFMGFPLSFLSSDNGDWGDGAEDNLPDDVFSSTSMVGEPETGNAFSGYGAGATFTCNAVGCDPAP